MHGTHIIRCENVVQALSRTDQPEFQGTNRKQAQADHGEL
jgi:hypothetical protein